jgi:uncharacterized protein
MSTSESAYLSEEEARRLYQSGDAAHDFDHILRVTHLAHYIAEREGARVEIVRLAALLHDVPVLHDTALPAIQAQNGEDETSVRTTHHLAAAEFARNFLRDRGLPLADCTLIGEAIESHRFRDRSRSPQTLEAKVLYDADKLDSMGAIGIARAFAYAGHHANRLYTESSAEIAEQVANGKPAPTPPDYTPVHEFVFKLRRLFDTLHTPTARTIGTERQAFMQSFFSQLEREMRCEW